MTNLNTPTGPSKSPDGSRNGQSDSGLSGATKDTSSRSDDVKPMAVVSLGFTFAAALIGFGYAGQWLDTKFGTAPVLLMVGVFFGGGGTFYLSYRRLTAPRSVR